MEQTEKRLRFGHFQFDLREQRLATAEGEIPLNPKSAAVLAYLLERRGRIVPKEELLQAVWQGTAVTDDAIVQRILDIRKALGENPKAPQFIRTHPKRGYEFAGAVTAPIEPARSKRRRRLAAMGILLTAAAAVLGWRLLRAPDASPEQGETRITQLTFLPGMEDYPAFDPAGRRILHTSDEGGHANLWIYDRDNGERHRITDSGAHLSEPDWSPDGEWIAYRAEEGQGGLYARSLVTGEAIRIADFGHHPRWSPDSRNVAFHSGGATGEVLVWSSAGRSCRRVEVTAPPLANRTHPVWSADGRFLYFIAYTGSAAGRDEEEARKWVQLGHQIWRVPVSGGEAKVATPGTGILRDGGFDLDPRRSQLVFVGLDRSLWRSTIDPATGQETARPVRLTLTTQGHQHPRVNARGEVVFSAVAAPETLWLVPFARDGSLDDRRMERLAPGGASVRGPALSPDGRRVAYYIWQGERFELWILDLVTGAVHPLGPADRLSRTAPAWSQDGRWLSYTVLEGRHREARAAAFNPEFTRLTGERPAAAAGPPMAARTRPLDPTGRYTLLVRSEGRRQALWVAGPGGRLTRLTPPGHYFHPSWSTDGRRIFFQSDTDGWFNIWALGFDPVRGEGRGAARQISFFRGSPYLISDSNLGYAVQARGLVMPLRENRSDLWMIRK